jgi:hypothetical protein
MGMIYIAADTYYGEASTFPRHDALVFVCDGNHATPRIAAFVGKSRLRQAVAAGWDRSPTDEVLCPDCAIRPSPHDRADQATR